MPPKKKKTSVSPVVVGTVSTRSTRRQSIVNIHIPKLSKSVTKSTNLMQDGRKNTNDAAKVEFITGTDDQKNLSEKIKASYCKVVGKNTVQSWQNDTNKTLLKTDTAVVPETNIQILQSDKFVAEISNVKKTLESNIVKCSVNKGKKLKSNRALLQILEDWTDDESEDDIQSTSSDEVHNSEFNKTKILSENVPLTTQTKFNFDENASLINETSLDSAYLLDNDQSVSENERYSVEVLKDNFEAIEIAAVEETETVEVVEEYIVEENNLLIDEQIEEDQMVLECVTEEIISDGNENNVLIDTTGENSISSVLEGSQETVDIKQIAVAFEETGEQANKSAEKVACGASCLTDVKENIVLEETNQSLSTSDSNDAEVRRFFAKEIENNEVVKEENISNLEYQYIKARPCLNTEKVIFEENLIDRDIPAKIENVCSEKKSLEATNNYVDEQKRGSHSIDIKEIRYTNVMNKNYIEDILEQKIMDIENYLEEVEQKQSTVVDQNHMINHNKMDIPESQKNEISSGFQITDLAQKDERINEDKFIKEELNFVVTKQNNVEEQTSKDLKCNQYNFINQDVCMKEEKLEECSKIVFSKKNKTRRTRSCDLKLVKDQVEGKQHSELTKPKKDLKIKPKDVKNRKKQPNKKIKEKTEKQDCIRAEKKETGKKTGKFEIDQSRKIKIDIDSEDTEVRRSSRIKSISVLKKKTTGHGLVRSKSEPILNECDISDSNSIQTESERSTPSASPKVSLRERKTRWPKLNENLYSDTQLATDPIPHKTENQVAELLNMEVDEKPKLPMRDPIVEARLKQFIHLKENMYKTDRMTCKEAKKMTCDCFLTTEEIEANEYGCGEDCLNRLLLIECGNLCQVGDRCTNKRFQKSLFAPVEVFNTEKKGLGLRAAANIPFGEFILEYVGEVLNPEEFDKRAEVYSQDKNIHYYFMSLRADAIIDATIKGNISRFINHSCDPNAETQKWTVNGELRIGFFSTRTILAGEEITFDYRFQRYGKEAQKCYCEAAICRGWLGEQPDEDSEEDDDEIDEEEDEDTTEIDISGISLPQDIKSTETQPAKVIEVVKNEDIKLEKSLQSTPSICVSGKRRSSRKKSRKELFEEIDQLDEEIEILITTGLKNQAHTLKLSRLMVRAKEPKQRTKLLRILRRGELPCRRLFLDYHGLRLIHGYMIDAQHLVHSNKKYESLRLEMLQTLAVLPIPNKTMLQDSKVLSTVEKWSLNKDLGSPLDSESSSPKNEQDIIQTPIILNSKEKIKDLSNTEQDISNKELKETSIEDQEEEIRFLATKLLEEWNNLKEVFRIPKKERIEQMKEHEREANKKFMQSSYGSEHDSMRKNDRYRNWSKFKIERETGRKGLKSSGKPSAEFIRLSKIERRKLFALQHELKEEERRLKQREMWRQHELNCMMIGTDPRFTAPFDPSRGYQYIWNPQIGQWQNYPLPPQNPSLFPTQSRPTSNVNLQHLPNLSLPPPQLSKSVSNFPFPPQMGINNGINGSISQLGGVQTVPATNVPQVHAQHVTNMSANMPHINTMQGIPGALPQNMPTHPTAPTNVPSTPVSIVQYQEQVSVKEEDSAQVKFMGPIPPPVKLPSKWKCAKDKYGRPYYYHIKIRKSQWEPPPFVEPPEEPDESSDSVSSSETSSISSDTSSDNSDSDDDIDDAKLLIDVRKQMEKSTKLALKTVIPDPAKIEGNGTPSLDDKNSDNDMDLDEDFPIVTTFGDDDIDRPSIDIRLKEQFDLLKDEKPPKKKRRIGLCEEIIISPRSEEDKLQFREDLKRYKANKEKLKRHKELILQQTRKHNREKRLKTTVKSRIKEMPDFNSESAKKIKENFRSNMASTVVSTLNVYRKPDCNEGRITNTEDFKHLARKLTHFVMLKEMKHISKIEELTCTDNVKTKAREYIRKYMSKFGEVYIKRNDSPDFKD